VAAANIGDDTDTVGCMATAIAGTMSGSAAFPDDWLDLVQRVSGIRIAPLAEQFVVRLGRG
jgi:ADP-ribosylglycohydrolase